MAATNKALAAAAKKEAISDVKEIGDDLKEIAEDTVELLEDTVEFLERKASWLVRSNPRVLVVTASLAGVVVGSALTYLIASKRISSKWQKIADEQVEQVKSHYTAVYKPDVELADLASKYQDEVTEDKQTVEAIVKTNGYTSYNEVAPTAVETPSEPVASNVFESVDPDTYFVFEEELARREAYPNQPFVITSEEYEHDEAGFEKAELTYYDEDDVLCDSDDTVVPVDSAVGVENMLRFGHGSGDPEVVYVRSPQLGIDFEVTHNAGSYAEVVLGQARELRHSDRPQRRVRQRYEQ